MPGTTIADIAREAGVSVTTVSRFINGNYGKMSEATKLRIQETVRRLDYRPSASARRMRQGSTHVVGVIVADISNVFSSLLFKGIDAELRPAGYDVMLMNSDNSLDEERAGIDRMLSQRVDGLVLQPNAADFSAYRAVVDAGVPMVVVDREPAGQPDSVPKVVSDNVASCYALGGHLADMGYENVVAVSRVRSQISAQGRRVEGLRHACEERGMFLLPLEVGGHDVAWLTGALRVALSHLNGRTAVVSLMGPLLFDLLAALRGLGMIFPEDIGLVSYDDWDWSQYVRDGIYLLEQDPQELGRAAARTLLGRMNGGDAGASPTRIKVPINVVESASV